MAVRVGLTAGVQALGASSADKSVHNQATRTSITAFSIYNTLAINVSFTIYDSPDGTSASGTEVANCTVGPKGSADDSVDVLEVIGQAYVANRQIIVVIDTAGVSAGELNAKLTFTSYTGES